MKKKNITLLVASFLLSAFLNFGNTAQAGVLSSIANAADSAALEMVIGPFTKTSLQEISLNISKEAKWMMIIAVKDNIQNSITIPATPGKQKQMITLREGPGSYRVYVYISNTNKFDKNSYKLMNSFEFENLDQKGNKYLLPTILVPSNRDEIIALAKTITAGETTDKGKVKKINDYLMKTIKYDFNSVSDGSYKNKAYDAITILKAKIGVCSGYANLFAALARSQGIKTKVMNGEALGVNGREMHAWNEVFLEGKWLPIDTTWNTVNKYYRYFLDRDTLEQDHFSPTVMPY